MSAPRPNDPTQPTADDLRRLYRSLRLIRRVEEEVARVYPTDKIKSPVHLSIGQEAVAVGVCDPLETRDYVSPTYRGHAAYLAKGGSVPAMIAELYGKATGCAAGKGGSMHLIAPEVNVMGASAVVGTTVPTGLGAAFAQKRLRTGAVVAVFLGDGATEEGAFYESLNFAALHRLPVLFVMENNGLAIHTGTEKRWATDRICERVETYGIPAQRFPTSDVIDIRAATIEAIAAMRDGGGPHFLECVTYRWREHVGPGYDYDQGYRDDSAYKEWQARDQVELIGGRLTDTDRDAIDAAIETEIAEAFAFAEDSPWPEPDRLYADLYADRDFTPVRGV
ncbi:MAG: thiamine pyrophosphate-dependent dehydrogenase E1 component subunit alpha [Alphaproteobacteria bacterium]|nr:thiamine pyrophosphate-dependent dehydrogenase E1 component subunit alpha [Alphaproteobacteria bacterium]